MKNKILLVLVVMTISLNTIYAQHERKNAINICAIAIPVLNMYVVNYEYLYNKHHGLAARIEYAPNLKGADTKGDGWSAVLNYRWHFSPRMKNFFVGPYVRYRKVYGNGKTKEAKYDFDVSEVNLGVNGGYRWVLKNGFNIVLAAGYGYSFGTQNLSSGREDVKTTFSKFKKANNTNTTMLDSPFYGEVSFGYAF